MRVTVRVQPRARRPGVGGRHGTAEPPVLCVRVAAPAVDGRANAAVVDALAAAVGVPKRAVTIVTGQRGRTKVVDIDGVDAAVIDRLVSSGG